MYGSLINNCFVDVKTKQAALYIFNPYECDNADCWVDYTDGYGYYEVNPETVGQFTGLLDKYGTEIYEGDKLKYNGWLGVIEFNVGAFFISYKDGTESELNEMSESYLEVISNIHEESEVSNG